MALNSTAFEERTFFIRPLKTNIKKSSTTRTTIFSLQKVQLVNMGESLGLEMFRHGNGLNEVKAALINDDM